MHVPGPFFHEFKGVPGNFLDKFKLAKDFSNSSSSSFVFRLVCSAQFFLLS